tara:strand:- start:6 stop:1073 length:1068 start_codon:yes stop_codon:yes gene_type:complete
MSPPPPPPPPPSCPSNGTVIQGEGGNFGSVMWYNAGGHYCKYNYDFNTLQGLSTNPGGTQYGAMINRFCGRPDNLAKSIPGNKICAEHAAGIAIATQYCGQGDNIITQTSVCDSGEPLGAQGYQQLLNAYCTENNSKIKESGHPCAGLKTSASALYNTISEAFCEANPNDPFCSCYNVLKDKCDPTSKTGVAGCSDTGAYVDLRNATPDDFKSVWDGQRKCGSICAGANKYIPPGITNGCKTTIQICAQDINVETASGSDIKASCELNANEGSSSGGGGGGGGGGDTEQETITIPRSVEEVRSFLPTSIDDLRTSKKKQVGVTTVGGSSMSMICCVILLILSTTMGAGPVARRFR